MGGLHSLHLISFLNIKHLINIDVILRNVTKNTNFEILHRQKTLFNYREHINMESEQWA